MVVKKVRVSQKFFTLFEDIKNQILYPTLSILPNNINSKIQQIIQSIIDLMPKGRPTPDFCSLFMTEKCNFQCPTCYRQTVEIHRSKDITILTIKKLMQQYPSIHQFVVAGLGEPTLNHDFVEIVNYLKKTGNQIAIVSNGTNLNKFLELEYEPNEIIISLNGFDDESFLRKTGLKVFDTVLHTILELKKKFQNVKLLYILNRVNYRELEKVLEICDKVKPTGLQLVNLLVYNILVQEDVDKIITVNDKEIRTYIDQKCANRTYPILKPYYIDIEHPKFSCRSYSHVINLDGFGNIGGCMRQIPPNNSCGDVFSDKDPYNSPKMRKYRNLQNNCSYPHPNCKYCFGNHV